MFIIHESTPGYNLFLKKGLSRHLSPWYFFIQEEKPGIMENETGNKEDVE